MLSHVNTAGLNLRCILRRWIVRVFSKAVSILTLRVGLTVLYRRRCTPTKLKLSLITHANPLHDRGRAVGDDVPTYTICWMCKQEKVMLGFGDAATHHQLGSEEGCQGRKGKPFFGSFFVPPRSSLCFSLMGNAIYVMSGNALRIGRNCKSVFCQ